MNRTLRKIRESHKWWFRQMQWAKWSPSLLERRWKFQSRKSLYGVIRVKRLDGSFEAHRAMPSFRLDSVIVRNAAGRMVVKFFELSV